MRCDRRQLREQGPRFVSGTEGEKTLCLRNTTILLEGSWYLLTNYNWAYNPTYKWDRVIRYSYNWLVSTMNLQVPSCGARAKHGPMLQQPPQLASPQRAQCLLIKEHALNHTQDPLYGLRLYSLAKGALGCLGQRLEMESILSSLLSLRHWPAPSPLEARAATGDRFARKVQSGTERERTLCLRNVAVRSEHDVDPSFRPPWRAERETLLRVPLTQVGSEKLECTTRLSPVKLCPRPVANTKARAGVPAALLGGS